MIGNKNTETPSGLLRVSVYSEQSLSFLDHLPGDLHKLMRGSQGPFAYLAKHLGEFHQAWLAIEALDFCQRAVALNELLHLVVLIAKSRELREMCHTKDLV